MPDPAAVLRDYAALAPLAFAVAHCADRSPRAVLNAAWHACGDAPALALAARAAAPRVVAAQESWAFEGRQHDWWVAVTRPGALVSYDLTRRADRIGGRWQIRNAFRAEYLTTDQFRRVLRRAVPLRALLARLGLDRRAA